MILCWTIAVCLLECMFIERYKNIVKYLICEDSLTFLHNKVDSDETRACFTHMFSRAAQRIATITRV